MLKIGSIVINGGDFEGTAHFWREALGYVDRTPAERGWVVLKDPAGTGPNLSVQGTPDLRFGRNRMHLDLYADDREAEVARLLALGATVHRPPQAADDFVILADPEGKLFCVVQQQRPGSGSAASRPPAPS